jgi:hypothetical protein
VREERFCLQGEAGWETGDSGRQNTEGRKSDGGVVRLIEIPC